MYLAIVTAPLSLFFFFNDTATTEIYTLSLHDALPISFMTQALKPKSTDRVLEIGTGSGYRSEEHTSELQSQSNLVCRLLLEKKKTHQPRPCPPLPDPPQPPPPVPRAPPRSARHQRRAQ